MGQDILVVAEHMSGEFQDVTFELIGKGRELATATGGKLCVAVLGSGMESAAASLGAADHVFYIDHANLENFNPEAYVAALSGLLDQAAPRLTLIANTSMGMDLAASLATRKNMPLAAYAIDVAMEGSDAVATSQLYGGKIYSETVLSGDAGIVAMLAGSTSASAGQADGSPEVSKVEAPEATANCQLKFVNLLQPEGGDVDITTHETLIGVGRGIQSEDNLPIVESLAEVLGGAVCSSRPIVDNKWLPKTRQVGKSGLKVKPKIYLAIGISGAPEHIEGMKDAELIIAINSDETAPIFEHAHYGTTEDLFDVVPALTEKLK